ncbi:MAG: iron ABC transporter permease [Paraglaciecola sp.]|uniref:FecCD family ABC transporter permease n=1 Tax=Paraglaciecola sp. TaxID=1920173 RepID=UPI0032995FB1
MKPPYYHFVLLLGLVLLALALLCSVSVGSRNIPLNITIDAFRAFDTGLTDHLLVRELRVPRTLVTFFCGSALSVAGLLMQSMTRNLVAEPGLLGVSAGASFGVVIGISLFGMTAPMLLMVNGSIGAGLCAICIMLLVSGRNRMTTDKLILAGVAFSSVCLALSQLLIVSSELSAFDSFRQWMVGSTGGRGFDILLPLVICWFLALILTSFIAPALDAMVLGETLGKVLGVNAIWLWRITLVCITLLAGAATAAAGPIIFIGLVVPYFSRLLSPASHYRQLVACALYGGIILLLADILGRVLLAPDEVSVGVVMAMLGGPFFIYLVRRDLQAM